MSQEQEHLRRPHVNGTTANSTSSESAPRHTLTELEVAPRSETQSLGQGIVVAPLVGFDAGGAPLVEIAEGEPSRARSTTQLSDDMIGQSVAVAFEGGRPSHPIVLGPILETGKARDEAPSAPVDVVRDGERVTLSADREIVLRCGESSITLTRAGKILIRGKYLLSRSSGVNRIKGGSVQIN